MGRCGSLWTSSSSSLRGSSTLADDEVDERWKSPVVLSARAVLCSTQKTRSYKPKKLLEDQRANGLRCKNEKEKATTSTMRFVGDDGGERGGL